MRRPHVAASFAVILLLVAPSGLAEDTDVLGDEPWDVRNEPNHPLDASGLIAAEHGYPSPSEPTRMLESVFRGFCGATTSMRGCYWNEWLFTDVADRTVIMPGLGEFVAILGIWYDFVPDGVICDRPDDPDGSPAEPAYDGTCYDEFDGASEAVIYGFTEPGNHRPVTSLGASEGWQPDFEYEPSMAASEGYYRSSGGIPFLSATGSFLETVTVRTATDVILAPLDDVPYHSLPSSLVDVDEYESVDPIVESMWLSIRDEALQRTAFIHEVVADIDAAVAPHDDDLEPVVGAAHDQVFKPWRNEAADAGNAQYLYAEDAHPFMDVRVTTQVYAGDPLVTNRFFIARDDDIQPSLAGGDHSANPIQFAFAGRLGLWYDWSADGWIGDVCPGMDPDCDPYKGGTVDDPNRYDDASEFVGVCPVESIAATLTPEGGKWGAAGVYVIHDADDGGSNPYDDVVGTIESPVSSHDVRVTRHVLEGPIDIDLRCDKKNPGILSSLHQIVSPEGSFSHRIEVAVQPVNITFRSGYGVIVTESTWDVDNLESWMPGSI